MSNSVTTPASPGQIGPFPFDSVALVTTAGSSSVVKLNGTQIGTTLAANQLIPLKAGNYLTVTWATTAPVFSILPV